MKIFVSPFKGGTTSLAVALGMVGFKRWNSVKSFGVDDPTFSLDDLIEKRQMALISEVNKVAESFGSFNEIPSEISRDVERLVGPVLRRLFGDYDVADDHPLGHETVHPYVKKIVFKDAKFIFVERPIEDYLKSVKKHLLKNEYKHVYGHCIRLFCGSSLGEKITIENYKKWKSNYLSLKKDFPNDVLIMDLEDGWQPLSSFIGFEIPQFDFPWLNKSDTYKEPCSEQRCVHEISYCSEHDSYYCPVCMEWREEKCLDDECRMCRTRPDRPLIQGGD